MSRYLRLDERKNIKKAAYYFGAATLILAIFLYIGVPLLAKFAIFLSDFSSSPTETSDTVAPAPPRLAPKDEYTNKENVNINGFSEPETEVELFINGEESGNVLSDQGGEFLFSDVKLKLGLNEIYVTATDTAGNKSHNSPILKIVLDKSAPELSVSSPTNGQEFSGDNKSIQVIGQTEGGVEVRVNGREVQLSEDNRFSGSIQLSDGDQEIKIEAIDKAGNKTETTVKVVYRP